MRYRRASLKDARLIASIFRTTRETCLPYLPVLHTPEDDVGYFSGPVLREDAVWVAESNDGIVGFCAFGNGWLNHLYVLPTFQRSGVGAALLQIAMRDSGSLKLWVFQQNVQAIRFYEALGFTLVKKTNGAENEEGVPDALYRRE